MVDTDHATVALQRHIIERPRLLKLLEEATARVILLTAPAGYGKTTLARQWSHRRPRVIWCSCTNAASDPAALALMIAREIEGFAPEDARRIRTFLRASQAGVDVAALADRIVSRMRTWPEGTWLFVDDYHLVPPNSGGAALIAEITAASPLLVLIASRVRPDWASRSVLYGDVLELESIVLTMTATEVQQVLRGRKGREVSWFTVAAGGWPAIVGLASLTTAELPANWSGEIHDYFASEVFALLSPGAQRAILRLALAAVVSPAAVDELVEGDPWPLLREGINQGFLTPTGDGVYVIHPLLLEYLRNHPAYPSGERTAIDGLFARLVSVRAWDETFALTKLHKEPSRLSILMREGIEDLLQAGRTRTLGDWVEQARSLAVFDPVVDHAASHAAFRAGEHLRAAQLARRAAARVSFDDPLRARMTLQAGAAAYFADDVPAARAFFKTARAAAKDPHDAREVLWQEFAATAYLGDPASIDLLSQYEDSGDGSAAHHVRVSTGRLSVACSFGGVSEALASAGEPREVIRGCDDPMINCSFLSSYARLLCMNAQYSRAAAVAREAVELARKHHLVFAELQTSVVRVGIEIGLRRYTHAAALLDRLERSAQLLSDAWVEFNALALRARVYAVHPQKLELPAPRTARHSNPRSEEVYQVSLALLAAAQGEWPEAKRIAGAHRLACRVIEVRVLAGLVIAITELAEGARTGQKTLDAALQEAMETGNLNAVVLAYRAYPRLLSQVDGASAAQVVNDLILQGGDAHLAKSAGVRVKPSGERRKLTAREAEILKLVGEGLTNPEIAALLFISPGTVKAHLQHAFEKLGVKSRAEAAVRAVAEDELGDL